VRNRPPLSRRGSHYRGTVGRSLHPRSG